jgi:multicomponent Na+:H+ antiporter subunit B
LKAVGTAVLLCLGFVLFLGVIDLPSWGDPQSPASTNVSPYYIENSLPQTEVPNIVSAVLADYRGFDTMLETVVVFCAGVAIIFLLRIPLRERKQGRALRALEESPYSNKIGPVRRDLILTTTCRIIFPIVQLFGFYVVAHGHHSPGGGFQGGVILGASYILLAIAFNLRTALSWLSAESHILLATLGVCIFVGTGLLCLLLGGTFLDYSALSGVLPGEGPSVRSLVILIVEIGVAFTVTSVMFSLFVDLSSRGGLKRGL